MHYLGTGFGSFPAFAGFGSLLFVVMVWSLVWKGLALWHSAQRGDTLWFLILMILNTAGILEIVYLFVFAKLKFHDLFSNNIKPTA